MLQYMKGTLVFSAKPLGTESDHGAVLMLVDQEADLSAKIKIGVVHI